MNIKDAVAALGALAQETRLQIFRLLVQAGSAGLSVGAIAERLGTEANGRLSFHLKELAIAGLVSASQSGRFIYYSANYPAMNELLAYLTEHCCGGTPCEIEALPCDPEKTCK
jgi:DNA-binding transcriptional ArsR family regulator